MRQVIGGSTKRSPKGPRMVTIRSDRLIADLDRPGEEIAEVLRQEVASDLKTTQAPAALSTVARRRSEGITSTTIGYATGQLANGLKLVQTAQRPAYLSLAVMPPSNRLVGVTMDLVRQRLVDALPVLMLRGDFWMRPRTRAAVQVALRRMVRIQHGY